MGKRKVTVFLMQEKEEDGGAYVAYIPVFPMCTTQGDTVEEALAAAKESLELHLECTGDDDLWMLDIAHAPRTVVGEIEVEVPAQESVDRAT